MVYAAIIGITLSGLNFANLMTHAFYFHYFELFSISLAVVSSDTFASELGIVDKKVYMITTMKRATPGINGGVSRIGEGAALLGAFIVALTYGLMNPGGFSIVKTLTVGALGFLGCQFDCILGATLENRNILSKGEVNFLSSLFAVIVAVPVLYFTF